MYRVDSRRHYDAREGAGQSRDLTFEEGGGDGAIPPLDLAELEASVFESQCRKILTALHRLRDKLQGEINYQRRARSQAITQAAAAAAVNGASHLSPGRLRASRDRRAASASASRERATGYTSSSSTSVGRMRKGGGDALSQHRSHTSTAGNKSSGRLAPQHANKALGLGPVYGWVLLRRINLRCEKLRILCDLAEEKVLLIDKARLEALAKAKRYALRDRSHQQQQHLGHVGGSQGNKSTSGGTGKGNAGGGLLRSVPTSPSATPQNGGLYPSAAHHYNTLSTALTPQTPSLLAPQVERRFLEEMHSLSYVIRTARQSIADFEHVEGQAMTTLFGLA